MVDLINNASGREPFFPPQNLLLVDFRDGPRLSAKWFLSDFGHKVFCARTAEEALQIFDPKVHEVVVLDALPPNLMWLEVARVVRERSPETPILVVTTKMPRGGTDRREIPGTSARLVALKEALDLLERDPS